MLTKLSLPYITELLKEVIPEYEEMLIFIEKNGGHFKLPPEANDLIERFKVDNYPELYRDEVQLMKMVMLGVMPAEEINTIAKEIGDLTGDAKVMALEELASHFTQSSIELFDSIPETEDEKQAAQKAYDQMTPEEQSKAIQQAQIVLSGFIPTFFNVMSMMVHGVKLTDLVSAAEGGNDEAFVLAVQIDKRILTLPYFRDRRAKAEVDQELDFLKTLNYRLTNPLLRSRIRYKTLWLSFAVLDTAGYLDGSVGYSKLLEKLDTIGIAGYGNRISDESALGRRIREYRAFQEINKKSRRLNNI